ncbi:ATP-binding protein [Streptomyces sp. H39-S7]|uniref:ATP-binding protein n=1 Tax=Streptomyces sp. H39-S7 TaxID=3004357 RepID=UPI0022AFB81C|nr:ATP-binding protein [Streptomyces sp. H39-S7]MCZ4125486.1 ATP-binding protein [Streptomyces sp. H39-S7]
MVPDLPETAEAADAAEVPVSVGFLYRAAHYEHGATGDARQMAEVFLKELLDLFALPPCERLGYDVALVVTELLTNAQRYAPGPCLLELEGHATEISVTVWDSNSALPVVFPRDPGRVGGHGMEIIDRICDEVHVERVPVGKRIRAVLAVPQV